MNANDFREKWSWKSWALDHSIAFFFLGLIAFLLIMTATNWETWSTKFNDVEASIAEDRKYASIRDVTLMASHNCLELQQAMLNSLSSQNNPDAWFPDSGDKALKIGMQRYEVLGCKP